MKLWLDDERPKPSSEWTHVKTASDAINALRTGKVTEMSLDHDLGPLEAGTGHDVARFVEKAAFEGTLSPIVWNVHSANPAGAFNIQKTLESADRFWKNKREPPTKTQIALQSWFESIG